MEAVHLVASVLSGLLLLYILVLLVRMVLDYIPIFNRGWRPQGAGLVIAEVVYLVTDPPIRLLLPRSAARTRTSSPHAHR